MDQRSKTMTEAKAPLPSTIDQTTLTPLVRRTLNNQTVEVITWDHEQLHAGAGEWSAVYRFSGQARDQEQSVPWSLILKTIRPQSPSCDSSAWNYSKREVDAYQSGWLDELPGGLAAPFSFDVIEQPDGTCWIWLEDVKDDIGERWPLEHYGVVARHLGQFNGAYLVDRPLPSWPWLSSGWLRNYIAESAASIVPLRKSLDHPLVNHWFPGDTSSHFFRLWENRALFLDALDRLPQTICHLDVFRRNLFAKKKADGDDQTVAVDWAFVGRGAIGEELVPLVHASVAVYEVDLDKIQELEDIVFEGYLEGLSDPGWKGDPQQVRLGYTAASLRYRFADLWRFLAIIQDESLYEGVEQTLGRTVEEAYDNWGRLGHLCDSLTDEARELIINLS